jgi:ABC-type nickel/cobalt efflux system permease component RcnA
MTLAAGLAEGYALCLTALTVGAVHTLLGPDHYVPFVAMSRAGGWSLGKTLRVTAACGLAHVAGSIAIGVVGLVFGLAVMRLETLEGFRGDAAAWLMIGFGLAYVIWGLVRAARSHAPHEHVHVHADGTVHSHQHTHDVSHLHVHEAKAAGSAATSSPVWSPWLLFLVFAFGPCEPLIPLLMYPAAKMNWWAVAAVALAFATSTIATMAAAVVVLRGGAALMPAQGLERYSHAVAGAAILACGVLITLGL